MQSQEHNIILMYIDTYTLLGTFYSFFSSLKYLNLELRLDNIKISPRITYNIITVIMCFNLCIRFGRPAEWCNHKSSPGATIIIIPCYNTMLDVADLNNVFFFFRRDFLTSSGIVWRVYSLLRSSRDSNNNNISARIYCETESKSRKQTVY